METGGTEERVIHMSDGHDSHYITFFILFVNDSRDGHFRKRQGRSKSLWAKLQGNGAAPSCGKTAFSNGVLPH